MDQIKDFFAKAALMNFLSKAGLILLCAAVVVVLSEIIKRALRRSKLEAGVAGFVSRAVAAVLWVIAFMIVLEGFGVPVNSMLAALGVAGLALSLSVQGLLSNLFAGVQIISTHPFAAGDYIEAGGVAGTVAEIRLFQTKLKTADNRIILVPNSQITAATITNYSSESERRVELRFPVPAGADAAAVRAAITSALSETPDTLNDPAPAVVLDSLLDGRAEYLLRVWTKNSDYWTVYYALNEKVVRTLREAGIAIAPRGVAAIKE